MTPSINCRNLIVQFERLELTAYFCPSGIPTIGYGHTRGVTQADVRAKLTISQEEAEHLLTDDIRLFSTAVLSVVKTPLNQNQLDALVSFAFNCKGWDRSTLVKCINRGDFAAAAAEFSKWVHGEVKGKPVKMLGLIRRRTAERALFEATA